MDYPRVLEAGCLDLSSVPLNNVPPPSSPLFTYNTDSCTETHMVLLYKAEHPAATP